MEKEWQAPIVALSLGISFIGSYTGITLYEQYRLITKDNRGKFLSKRLALLLMSLCFGGVTIWTMHFVGMSAIQIRKEDGSAVQIRYKPLMTIMSLLSVLVCVFVGLQVASNSKVFLEDEADTVANFIRDMRTMTINQIRSMPDKKVVLMRALFRDMPSIVIAGLCLASGVCVMHYMGMMAMVSDARIEWDVGVIVASVIIALVASCAAFWILFRLLSMFSQFEILRVACAVVMSVAVNGMHYTGVAAATFVPREAPSNAVNTIEASVAVLGAIVAAVIIVMFSLILSVADVRIWYYNLERKVRTLDEMFAAAKDVETASAHKHFLEDYEEIKELDGSVASISKFKKKVMSHMSSASSNHSQSIGSTVVPDNTLHTFSYPSIDRLPPIEQSDSDIESNKVWAKKVPLADE